MELADPRLLDAERDEPKVTIESRKGVGALRRQGEFPVPFQLERACNLAAVALRGAGGGAVDADGSLAVAGLRGKPLPYDTDTTLLGAWGALRCA